jgi:ribosomal protein S7
MHVMMYVGIGLYSDLEIKCPIIERLTCSLMMNGRNNGKKLKAVRIVQHSFEIVRF